MFSSVMLMRRITGTPSPLLATRQQPTIALSVVVSITTEIIYQSIDIWIFVHIYAYTHIPTSANTNVMIASQSL